MIGAFLIKFSHWMSWVSVIRKGRFFDFGENWTHEFWFRSPLLKKIRKRAISMLNWANFNHVICQVVQDGIFLPDPHTCQILLYLSMKSYGSFKKRMNLLLRRGGKRECLCTAQASNICLGVNYLKVLLLVQFSSILEFLFII